GQDLLRVHDHDGAVADVDLLSAAATVVLPGLEGSAEEGGHVVAAGPPAPADASLVETTALVVRELEGPMAELAHLRRARPNPALLVDEGPIVFGRARVEPEHRPAVLEREHRGEVVEDERCPELGLEGIDEQLRMAVEEAVCRVAAVLVHRAEHQQPKLPAHGCASPRTK